MIRLMAILGFLATAPTGPKAMADEYFPNASDTDQPIFSYGMSCSRLVDLTQSEVYAVVHPNHREDFEGFCVPEDVYNCSDYNGLLYQLGTLERHDGILCRFIPRDE
ncbi:hypothetical protein [Pseudobacteriovorax antillogorgiicola]|uniref:Uncharacterized protein n=1 Tax=Pseudobacteriovorax antillogorgiicola TaxID=1513793 RepID=A0A1Y6B809_9BACT|nr:hypothetical protein [Pseudobacteriovorax antillogorgiicola]TCS58669.1 hypothetical protein EDD56_102182 [Pseudobacteriovorax antillogorgiicola]SME96118.1 hypothetical protein SAMN06296036_102261 [Pseudobacteriovorax antillogorgiicola]